MGKDLCAKTGIDEERENVRLVHTGHDAKHLGPANDRKEHSERYKTSMGVCVCRCVCVGVLSVCVCVGVCVCWVCVWVCCVWACGQCVGVGIIIIIIIINIIKIKFIIRFLSF